MEQTKKPRIVIIGAGMAGLTAANKLYTSISRGGSMDDAALELLVVEGGSRIGGRINTSEFGGNRVEMGATWIHGIDGSPIHGIAKEIQALVSEQPWECMHGFLDGSVTMAEGGHEVSPCIVERVSTLFRVLMGFAGNPWEEGSSSSKDDKYYYDIAAEALEACAGRGGSLGSFLRKGLEIYWQRSDHHLRDETIRALEEATFSMHENTQRTYTSAGDLFRLDFIAEREYRMFPGEEVTIARGYSSIIDHLASALPKGMIQLNRKVSRIQWDLAGHYGRCCEDDDANRPVKVHFSDGSVLSADHVIVTVSLGVLKAGISQQGRGLFCPPLPDFKIEAISRLGFGVVNKLFIQEGPSHRSDNFPFLQMAFHPSDSEISNCRKMKVPRWMRRTASICPIHKNSNILLSWFAGDEALELEELMDQEIIDGVSSTVSCLLSNPNPNPDQSKKLCNGGSNRGLDINITRVLRSKWGSDPLFLGSYSYVQVGSSGDDLDALAEPLPNAESLFRLQILFAGEATHRTHYSTTHGAYFSGLREANRLLEHYQAN
ncbi:hypothetical protein SAY86_026814 [Trapa natans]|uniref:Amine oxidase domain-containing protein n=1 Tax=Trapa natans TaxID=22666 RepID=A0AAN7QF84_TRANT|nr:hypothetical protein SAY86_026814 [Trapa natans]